jgi:hypothetical protein
MSQLTLLRNRLDWIGTGILALTLITAIAHIYLGFKPDETMHTLFLLNGLCYLTLLAAFFLLQPAHHLVRWMLLGYTLLTIILWFFLGSPREGTFDPFDIAVKVVEITLIVLLFIDTRRDANQLAR